MPDNRGFCDFFAKKSHKNLQVPQAPRRVNNTRHGIIAGKLFAAPSYGSTEIGLPSVGQRGVEPSEKTSLGILALWHDFC
jgi:hypothetical protein